MSEDTPRNEESHPLAGKIVIKPLKKYKCATENIVDPNDGKSKFANSQVQASSNESESCASRSVSSHYTEFKAVRGLSIVGGTITPLSIPTTEKDSPEL